MKVKAYARQARRFMRALPLREEVTTSTSSRTPQRSQTARGYTQDTNYSTITQAPSQTDVSPECLHRHIKRSGNRRGSYAQCMECKVKWKWNAAHHGWEHFIAGSSSSRLPLPSPATVLDSSWRPAMQHTLPIQNVPPPTTRRSTARPSNKPPATTSKARPPAPTEEMERSPWDYLDPDLSRFINQPGRRGGLRLGERRRLVNDLNKASEVLTIENSIYDKIPAAMNVNHGMDIMELFAGEAKISELAPRHQLRALQPMDILYDVDLASPEGQRLCTQAQNKFKPLVLVAGIACTKWSIFNENLNYAGPGRAELLARLREEELPMVDFTVERCLQQIADGNFFALENPAGSRLWEQASVMNLTTRDDVYVVRCHSGAYGATNTAASSSRRPSSGSPTPASLRRHSAESSALRS